MVRPVTAELLQDLKGLSKPPYFDGNDADHQGFRFKFHGNRTHPDLHDSSEGARRGTVYMRHTDVLLVGFVHERKCANFVRCVEDSNWSESLPNSNFSAPRDSSFPD